MCLTGVDYFSTLGYQPSIAFLAAGYLSPFATLVLVLLTVFGALPVYHRIAALSPHGQGSLSVLEERLPRWRGKALVLCLLGFAATSFIITITLSAADAAAHIIENPFVQGWMHHPLGVTLVLLVALGAVFLRGFREAIWLAVLLVAVFLIVNVIVIGWELVALFGHPEAFATWKGNLFLQYPDPWMIALMSMVMFPRLALGLSGFETGVAVMPLVHGDGKTEAEVLESRIANTRTLLTTAALIMSVLLVGSAIVTATMIPADALRSGGPADGRALAYLAHRDLGEAFGTLYDLATIGTLWFAGASALAGLLNLVPQYLPRYGMAPDWARATRPLVVLFTGVCLFVTYLFDADVNAQGGAYATGVLMLITSAAVAVVIALPRERWLFVPISMIFQHRGAARRPRDRELVHRDDDLLVIHFAGGALDRDPDQRREVRRDGGALRQRSRRAQGGPDHRQSARYGIALRVRAQAGRGQVLAPPAGRRGAVPGSEARRRLGVHRRSRSAGRERRRLSRPALHESGDSQRDCRPVARLARSHRRHPARVLRLDGRQPHCVPPQVPGLR